MRSGLTDSIFVGLLIRISLMFLRTWSRSLLLLIKVCYFSFQSLVWANFSDSEFSTGSMNLTGRYLFAVLLRPGSFRFDIVYWARFFMNIWRSRLALLTGLTACEKISKVHSSFWIIPGILWIWARGTMNIGSFARISLALTWRLDLLRSSNGLDVSYSSNSNSVPSFPWIWGSETATMAYKYINKLSL